MAKLTTAQFDRLAWLDRQGGSGYLDRHSRVVAGGEVAPQGTWPCWVNLLAKGCITGADGRITITSYGRSHLKPFHGTPRSAAEMDAYIEDQLK